MSNTSDAQAVVDVALAAAEPTVLDPSKRYAVVVPGGGGESGSLEIIEPQAEKYLDAPRRVRGTSIVYDADSLKVLWDKYSTAGSELFADPKAYALTAVLNADGDGTSPAFRDHRAVLQCVVTPAWQAWLALDGKLGPQMVFAEHLENRAVDLHDPDATDMLELAQHFEATTKVNFKSAENLGSGQRGLVYEETVHAKAGHKGQLVIPQVFTIAVQVFEGGPAYKVNARLRYRMRDGQLAIGYALERPEDVKRAAFDDVATAASEACNRQPLLGAPFAPVV